MDRNGKVSLSSDGELRKKHLLLSLPIDSLHPVVDTDLTDNAPGAIEIPFEN
jgi:hypothetical protein